MKLVIQNIDEMDLEAVRYVVRIYTNGKVFRAVKVNGLTDLGRTIDFSEYEECIELLTCRKRFKHSLGVIDDTYYTHNIILAYSKSHLEELLQLVEEVHITYIDSQIEALQRLRSNFTSSDWIGRG